MLKKSFLLLVGHSSRTVDFERCSLNFLSQRFTGNNRLNSLPPFSSLPSIDEGGYRSYEGSLSLHHVSLNSESINLSEVAYITPGSKIQHAALAGERLILCFEDRVQIIPDWTELRGVNEGYDPQEGFIHDNWFAGLHTVFSSGPDTCILSSSAADAALELNIVSGKITKRWRLPEDVYGSNYYLSPSASIKDHYIHNNLQLAHLNCAFPLPDGNILVTTLLGDVGYFDADGHYSLLARGFVGAHGARLENNNRYYYFADSCLGLLTKLDQKGHILQRYSVPTKWLHDVQQLEGDIFMFSLGDCNEVLFENINTHTSQLRLKFPPERGIVQFLNLHRLD